MRPLDPGTGIDRAMGQEATLPSGMTPRPAWTTPRCTGLLPGTAIEFLEQEPFGGAFVVRVGDEIVRVGPQAAEHIFVGGAAPGSPA